MKDVPDINKNYQSTRDRIPLKERISNTNYGDNYDEKLQRKRDLNKRRNQEGDDGECAFAPKINKSASEVDRSVDDLLKWGDEKRLKLASKRLSNLQRAPSFTPEISKKSKRMTRNREGDLYERLTRTAQQKEEKMEEIRREYDRKFFKPKISEYSRKLAAGGNETELRKIENGKTKNLDFFQAEPIRTSKSEVYLSSKRPQRSRSKVKAKKKEAKQEKIKKHDPM